MTTKEMIRKILSGLKNGLAPHDLQKRLWNRKKFMSESTLTRILRDMDDVKAVRPKSGRIWKYVLEEK